MGVLCASVGFPVKAVPWLRRLVAGFSPARPGFAPGLVHVVLVVVKVTLGQIFSGFFGFSLSVSSHRSSLYSYRLRVSNMPVGGLSSETLTHTNDVNNNFNMTR
jgi:hypothetical protein